MRQILYDITYCGIKNNNKLVDVKKQTSRLTDTEGKLVVTSGERGGWRGSRGLEN